MPRRQRAKAVKLSYASSGPSIGPVRRDSSLQFEPNWNAITIPDTTPSPNATAKIFSQNTNSRAYTSRLVARCNPCNTASHAPSPMVKAGNMM